MKLFLFISMVVFTTSSAIAHEFFFGFAEMEYNSFTRKLELTLVVTTHDFERCIETQGDTLENIASLSSSEIQIVESYFRKHFIATTADINAAFNFKGNEVSLDGTTNFYFESAEIELGKEMDVTFDVLMETFVDQQNKLTFYFEGRTFTKAFTQLEQTQTIHIENDEE